MLKIYQKGKVSEECPGWESLWITLTTVNMSLFCTVSEYSEILDESGKFQSASLVFCALVGIIPLEFRRDLSNRKLESMGVV